MQRPDEPVTFQPTELSQHAMNSIRYVVIFNINRSLSRVCSLTTYSRQSHCCVKISRAHNCSMWKKNEDDRREKCISNAPWHVNSGTTRGQARIEEEEKSWKNWVKIRVSIRMGEWRRPEPERRFSFFSRHSRLPHWNVLWQLIIITSGPEKNVRGKKSE